MTFYEIVEQRFINHSRSISKENLYKSTYEGGADLSVYDKNKENFERAKRGRGPYKIEDFQPCIFHPSQAEKVIVHYTIESGKEPEGATLEWTQCHGELDGENHTYPDEIEYVLFIRGVEVFPV